MNVLKLTEGTIEDESVLQLRQLRPADRISDRYPMQAWLRLGSFTLHRIRGPAIIYKNGEEFWYRDDKLYEPTAHEKMMWELRKKNECS